MSVEFQTIIKPISPQAILAASSAATNMTLQNSSNVISAHKAAAAETITITLAISLDRPTGFGAMLNSISFNRFYGVADLTSITWAVYKQSDSRLGLATPAAPTSATIAATNTDVVTKTTSIGKIITISITTPVWEDATGAGFETAINSYQLIGTLVCPATSTMDFYSGWINYSIAPVG